MTDSRCPGVAAGLLTNSVMAVEAPELLPMDGHLIGNSNKTATGSYHCPSARLSSKDFGGRLAHELEAADPARCSIRRRCFELFGAAFSPACARWSNRLGAILLREGFTLPGHADARHARPPF
jgi:hypothetical protein